VGKRKEIPATILITLNEEEGKKLNELKRIMNEKNASEVIRKLIKHVKLELDFERD